MFKTVLIRNVLAALNGKRKERAARPTREEMLARLHGRQRVTLKTPAAVVIRDERGMID